MIGGHVVDSSEHSGCSSMVKMTSARLLNVVVKAQGLERLAGDVGNNAYLLNAETKEKIFTKCLEFGPEMVNQLLLRRVYTASSPVATDGIHILPRLSVRWALHH